MVNKEGKTMNELDGQDWLLILVLGEDAEEINDWESMALHEEELPLTSPGGETR